MLKTFLKTLPSNFLKVFSGRNIFWHLLAVILTYIFVMSGFDWWYFLSTRSSILQSIVFPAIVIGGTIPMYLQIAFIVIGLLVKKKKPHLGFFIISPLHYRHI